MVSNDMCLCAKGLVSPNTLTLLLHYIHKSKLVSISSAEGHGVACPPCNFEKYFRVGVDINEVP